ncbi:MAG: hypothetical protein BWY43_00632 [candidate division WS2 bacterium ADurb.Bin280]|uniref:Permease n=1 Tax=candidate division WS2 bacterium ADurb.Bin280 TaxID=1852829 RepID=A0A1V5SCV4_9BACT|nr:MAG: hypothetical protein BWY43_00632 [candidate division WS2 bacterium ADurb.Bin280]
MAKKSFLKAIPSQWNFLIIVIAIYAVLYFVDYHSFILAFRKTIAILKEVLPTLALVFVLLAVSNYLFSSKKILSYLKDSLFTKWLFAILGGILSSGPVYMWYPMMADLRRKFFDDGLVACFLYNRSVKLPLLPVMVVYFGAKYAIILLFVTIITSILQGLIINKLMIGEKK